MKLIRQYIAMTSIHDYAPYYQKDLILATIKELIAHKLISSKTNPRFAHQFGWSNQPQVVTFTAQNSIELQVLKARIEFVTGKPVSILIKDWS